MKLSESELKSFQDNGFIVLRNFVQKEQCEIILGIAKKHLIERTQPIETEEGYDKKSKEYRSDEINYHSSNEEELAPVRRLRQVYERDDVFREWMEDEKIRPILEQILNDKVVLTLAHHNSIMTKMPRVSTQTRWHQDRRYWHYSDNNLVSVWLALGEEYNENGVLEFIPKSHKMSFDASQFDDKEYLREDTAQNINLINTKVSTVLKQGDVVIFHSLLMHRANKNETSEPKIAFVYTVKGERTKVEDGSRSAAYKEIKLGSIE
jgi:phytanoyl-CoA hydroxylase